MRDSLALCSILLMAIAVAAGCAPPETPPASPIAKGNACENDGDCPVGSACVSVALSGGLPDPIRRCNASACLFASDCGDGRSCVAGLCTGGACGDTAPCPLGMTCVEGVDTPDNWLASGSCAVGRIVSDELLARRWPDGDVPYVLVGFSGSKEDQLREALGHAEPTALHSDCNAGNCVGWSEDNAIRFRDCGTGCASGTPFLNIVSTTSTNRTSGKRGFDGTAVFTTVKDSQPCDDPASDADCRRLGGYPGLTTARTKAGCALSGSSNCRIECGSTEAGTADNELCAARGAALGQPVPCDRDSNEQCVFDVWLRNSSSFMWNMAHEIGHALGFNHEQARYDRNRFLDFTACPQGAQTGILPREYHIGAYDGWSVMHYEVPDAGSTDPGDCWQARTGADVRQHRGFFDPAGGSFAAADRHLDIPSTADFAKLRRLYGVNGDWRSGPDDNWCTGTSTLLAGDFDTTPGADLYCHDDTGSVREAQVATTAAFREDGVADRSYAPAFCIDAGVDGQRQLHAADFDGDGLSDLLCHDTVSGSIELDLSGTDGWEGGDVLYNAKICNTAHELLLIGDFDGSATADLACHDFSAGRVYVKTSNATAGTFDGVAWGPDAPVDVLDLAKEFCRGPKKSRALVVGDFDGNGRDDLLCHDRATGQREIRFSAAGLAFDTPRWRSVADPASRPFCTVQARLYAADVDGAFGDDLVCFDPRIGSVSLDLAGDVGSDNGVGLSGEDWYHELSFCNAKSARLLIADQNGDGRDDLVCQNAATGHKALKFSSSVGRY